jgi:hypothetical protein
MVLPEHLDWPLVQTGVGAAVGLKVAEGFGVLVAPPIQEDPLIPVAQVFPEVEQFTLVTQEQLLPEQLQSMTELDWQTVWPLVQAGGMVDDGPAHVADDPCITQIFPAEAQFPAVTAFQKQVPYEHWQPSTDLPSVLHLDWPLVQVDAWVGDGTGVEDGKSSSQVPLAALQTWSTPQVVVLELQEQLVGE